jgi:hypothetical protein
MNFKLLPQIALYDEGNIKESLVPSNWVKGDIIYKAARKYFVRK